MTTFSGALARQQDVLFRRFGEDGIWPGITAPVRIRCKEWDDEDGFSESRAVVRVRFLKVRKSQVAQPVDGQLITREDGSLLKIVGEPRLNRQGVWICEVKPIQP